MTCVLLESKRDRAKEENGTVDVGLERTDVIKAACEHNKHKSSRMAGNSKSRAEMLVANTRVFSLPGLTAWFTAVRIIPRRALRTLGAQLMHIKTQSSQIFNLELHKVKLRKQCRMKPDWLQLQSPPFLQSLCFNFVPTKKPFVFCW